MKIKFILTIFAVLALALSTPAGVMADDDDHKTIRSLGSTVEVHFYKDGKVMARGAKVTAISGSTINAAVAWGVYSQNFAIVTDSNTKFVRKHDGASKIAEVAVGDFISFNGSIDTTKPQLTIKAAIVKNWSIQESISLSGTVKSLGGASTMTFVLQTHNRGDVNVAYTSATKFMRGPNVGSAADIVVGARLDGVKGIYNSSTNTMVAESIRINSNEKLLEKRTFEGTLQSIAGTTTPTSFVMSINGANYTVNVPAGISILNSNWQITSLSSFRIGDKIRVYGAIRADSTTTIDATVVRDTSI